MIPRMDRVKRSKMASLELFMDLFKFDPKKTLMIGVERELFLTENGNIVPRAPEVLHNLHASIPRDGWMPSIPPIDCGNQISYELSACQIEGHVGPCTTEDVRSELERLGQIIGSGLHVFKLRASYNEVAPAHMPLDVFPDPTGRYQKIIRTMPPEVLLAACRIIGTHVHIGMPDHETALRVYNTVIGRTEELCRLGDHSGGERLSIYRVVKPDCMPRRYASWDEFYRDAIAKGFAENLRNNWCLVRLTKHGTIEFRMFGATESIDEVCRWVDACYRLCADAVR